MGRRVRHLNPRDFGAVQSVDARFITGVSNNTELGTWNDRAGSLSYSHGTAGQRPTFLENQVGGQPCVDFDGSNDRLTCTDTTVGTDFIQFMVARVDTTDAFLSSTGAVSAPNVQTLRLLNIYSGNNRMYMYGGGSNAGTYEYYSAGGTSMASWGIYSVGVVGTAATDFTFRQNGNALATTRTTTYGSAAPSFRIGMIGAAAAGGTIQSHGNEAIAAYTVINTGSLSAAARKRIEHSLAFSFKIPCS